MIPVPLFSEATYWRALALRRQGETAAAAQLLEDLRAAAQRQSEAEVRIDFFATSLPAFLLFEDDLARRNRAQSRYLEGLAQLGLGSLDLARAAFEFAKNEGPIAVHAAQASEFFCMVLPQF